MCLGVLSDEKKKSEEDGAQIIQAKCNPTEKGQNWKYDKSDVVRLCNAWNYCIFNDKFDKNELIQHYHRISSDKRQEWMKLKGSSSEVNLGFCLAIDKDSNAHGAAIITTDCDSKEKGQRWNFGPA